MHVGATQQPVAALGGAARSAPGPDAPARCEAPGRGDHAEERRRARASRAAARAAARAVPPQRSEEFARLSLQGLRAYRRMLSEEEDRVSYWRRILQARLDCVVAGEDLAEVDSAHLRPVLTSQRVGLGRRALVHVLPVDDIPPLPDLAELWDTTYDPRDPVAASRLSDDLASAEHQLSAYRAALHRRIAAATAELIARYRADPQLCLTALPC